MPVRAKRVLIVAPRDDIHALAVADRIAELYHKLVECWIFDTATYPICSSLNLDLAASTSKPMLRVGLPLGRTLGPRTGQFLLESTEPPRTGPIALDINTVVWWRRYRRPILHPDVSEPEFRNFCSAALESTLFSALSLCTIHNPINVEDVADCKLHQLFLARQSGLHVPRTLISTDREQIEAFVDEIEREGKRVIYKHSTAAAAFGMPTRIVDAAARARFDALAYAPSIFQEEISGGYDLRVAVIGTEIYCCEWRGSSQVRRFADVKLEDGLRMWAGSLPDGLRAPLIDLHGRLGLTFGIYDFKMDEDEHPFFLEVNPSGQWLDMEIDGGQPVSESVARVLVEGHTGAADGTLNTYKLADLDRITAEMKTEELPVWRRIG